MKRSPFKSRSKPMERKPFAGGRKAMKRVGKSNRSIQRREWESELKAWVEANLEQRCEMCGTTINLSKAHSKKRRYIYTREDYFEIALLCTTPFFWKNRQNEWETIYGCHGKIERMSSSEMEAKVKEIIARRDT